MRTRSLCLMALVAVVAFAPVVVRSDSSEALVHWIQEHGGQVGCLPRPCRNASRAAHVLSHGRHDVRLPDPFFPAGSRALGARQSASFPAAALTPRPPSALR